MGPLAGVRVLDLSRLLPGPYCTLLLADLGAEVIKVEDPNGGDYARYFPPVLDDGASALFHALNRGKRSVALDLRSGDGKAAFERLVKTADVVVESFRPGVLEKLGLAPETLLGWNQRLVVCRISGYGQDGPDRLKAGHDINYAAKAGVLGMMKRPDVLPVQVGDLAGGAWPAALQIVAALYGRSSTGKGAVIDVSMTDWARAMLVMPVARHAATGEAIGGGVDFLSGAVPCYGVYPTRDGYLSVGALEPKFWMAFCAAADLTDLADSGLVTGDEAERVKARVEARLREKTSAEWGEILAAADCCCEPVATPEEGSFASLGVDIAGGKVQLPVPPLSLVDGRRSTAAPGLGADGDLLKL